MKQSLLTQERLKELLTYSPTTGIFVWLPRKPEDFPSCKTWTPEVNCRIWNGRYSGKIAGTLEQSHGYIQIKIGGLRYPAHRLAHLYMTGAWPEDQVDHDNLNRSDNRWENLRPADPSKNQANTPLQKNNTTGHKGTAWHKRSGKWQARIHVNGKKHSLGYFTDIEDASRAYDRAAIEHFGPYSRTNFPRSDYLPEAA